VALLPVLLVLVLAVAVAAGAAVLRRTPPSSEAAVAAARAHTRLVAAAAVATGVAAALGTVALGIGLIPRSGATGTTILLTPLAYGVAHTSVLLVGELTWPRPAGQIRTARLIRRGPWDAAPSWLARLAAATAAVAGVTLVAGGLLADDDGRSITVASGDTFSHRASPFPGMVYGLPAGVGLLVLAGVTVAALIAVANRAAVLTHDDRVETALRRGSAHRVLRGATGPALVTVGGLLLSGGRSVTVVGTGLLSGVGTGVAVVGGVAILAGLVVTVLPAPRLPHEAPLVPAG
jgi:hypothetical protein